MLATDNGMIIPMADVDEVLMAYPLGPNRLQHE
jgi:hypothetical protein